MRRKCRRDVDRACSGTACGGGAFAVYLFDVKRNRELLDSGEWAIGGWNLRVRESTKLLLDRRTAQQ